MSVNAWFPAPLALLLLCGCGVERVGNPVSGQVTFQGRPLNQGTIEFTPAEGQGTLSGGMIEDGRYQVAAEHGLKPGKYDVRISSFEGASVSVDGVPGESPGNFKELIPAKFNSATTLSVQVQEAGENKFDFQIP